MIRLVISDLDGTLIDGNEKLPPAAYELADFLRKKGVMFSLATGRVYELALPYASELGVRIPFVTSNGAAITCIDNCTLVRYRTPFAPFSQIIRKCDEMNLTIYHSSNGFEHIHRKTDYICSQQQKTGKEPSLLPLTAKDLSSSSFEKLSIVDGYESGVIAEVEKQLKNVTFPFNYTRYCDRAIEIVAHCRTKGAGVRDLAKTLGISMDEVLCIGDDANDVDMLKEAGIGAAVSNALPEAKACADYISPSDHAQGALETVRKFCI